ncbi:hypothetical protein [Terrisporobacter sp.]
MRLSGLNEYEIRKISNYSKQDKIEWIGFFKDISYKAQIFVLEDRYAENILKKIYICGGAVRRKDLIDIGYDGDKNMYNYISKLIKNGLLNQEGKRDSILYMTTTSLSIISKKRVKNSINISDISSNMLDKAAFLLTIEKKYNGKIQSESEFISNYIDNIIANDYISDPNIYERLRSVETALESDFKLLTSNGIYSYKKASGFNTLFIYALNPSDLMLKISKLQEIKILKMFDKIDINAKTADVDVYINKIITLDMSERQKSQLEEFKKEKFDNLKLDNLTFEYIERVW